VEIIGVGCRPVPPRVLTRTRYFQTTDELARRREKKRGVKGGSDGSSTRERHLIEVRA